MLPVSYSAFAYGGRGPRHLGCTLAKNGCRSEARVIVNCSLAVVPEVVNKTKEKVK